MTSQSQIRHDLRQVGSAGCLRPTGTDFLRQIPSSGKRPASSTLWEKRKLDYAVEVEPAILSLHESEACQAKLAWNIPKLSLKKYFSAM